MFLSIGLFAVAAAVAGHEYFASDSGRARRIIAGARARPAAAALRRSGCARAETFTAAEAAQLAHTGKLGAIALTPGAALVLCHADGDVDCGRVGDAYTSAEGELPAQVMVLGASGVSCSVLRVVAPAGRRVEP